MPFRYYTLITANVHLYSLVLVTVVSVQKSGFQMPNCIVILHWPTEYDIRLGARPPGAPQVQRNGR
jgi:hypothetical protein